MDGLSTHKELGCSSSGNVSECEIIFSDVFLCKLEMTLKTDPHHFRSWQIPINPDKSPSYHISHDFSCFFFPILKPFIHLFAQCLVLFRSSTHASPQAPASRADGYRVDPGDFGFAREPRLPLVNVYITMENHHAINGLINYDNFQ